MLLEKSARAFKPDPAMIFEPLHIRGMEAEWLIPPDHKRNRIILYIHGGGYIAGSIHSHRDLASRIAKAARARVLIFNYRLAPEHPFPAGLNDAERIYEWLTMQWGETHDLCLVSDSAGGGIALALLVSCIAGQRPLPKCAVFMSPWVDLVCETASYTEKREVDFMLNQDILKKTVRLYTDKSPAHPMISPINNSFTGIPPVLIQVGENEVLLDDARLLAEKILQDKGIVQLEIWKEMFHVWHYFSKYLSEGRDAILRIGDFIRSYTPASPDQL
jgi:acetyl esterase/lipase